MKKTKNLLVGLGFALGIIVLSLLLRTTSIFDEFEKKLTHGLYRGRPVHEEILIVGIDEKTLLPAEEGGLGTTGDWPREFFGTVINNLRNAGSHSIFLDAIFPSETEALSHLELSTMINEAESFEEIGREVSAYIVGANPSDKAFAEALMQDVFLLKATDSDGTLLGNKLVAEGTVESYDLLSQNAEGAFGDVLPDGNQQALYSLPIGFEINGVFEEAAAMKIARDYLYRGQETSGFLSADGQTYLFDSGRVVPVERGQFLVNYSGKSRSFPIMSFADVFRGEIDPSVVEGKIVLIGPTATVLQDLSVVPIDPDVPMPRVEVQANAIQTILDGNFLKHQTMIGFLLMVTVMVLVSFFVFMYLPALFASGFLVIELVAFPLLARFMFGRGVILDLIWPVIAVLATYLAILAYRNFTEFKEKREIRNAFSHYVSKDLVEQIVENPEVLRLGGERRELSVMFVDLENFTSMSEDMHPQEVVQIINTYFDALTKVIMAHGGTVDKFEGDAIMALFGAPIPGSNHAVNACTAALSLREKIAELNQATGLNLNLRIGIASGPAVVGNMGSKDRFDYTAIGDVVNTASRLESGNKHYGTRILVNNGTCADAQKWIAFRRIDTVRFKGKEKSTHVYEILGLIETLSHGGALTINEWHSALEYYRNQEWDEAIARIRKVQEKLPHDGPSKTLIARIEHLKAEPPGGWDAVWDFN